MKKYLLFLTALLLVACSPKDGVITIAEDGYINLGKVKEADGPVELTCRYRNSSADTNVVFNVLTGCSCTAIVPANKVVAPGEYLSFKVTYDPAYRKGEINEGLCVRYANGNADVFYLKGNVIPCTHPMKEDCRYDLGSGLHTSYSTLFFGNNRPGDVKRMYFHVGNGNTKSARIEFKSDDPNFSSLSFRQPGKMKADQRDTIHVKFTMPDGIDTVKFELQPYVNGKPVEKTIKVISYARKD